MTLKNILSTVLALGLFGAGLLASDALAQIISPPPPPTQTKRFPPSPCTTTINGSHTFITSGGFSKTITGSAPGMSSNAAGADKALYSNLSTYQSWAFKAPYAMSWGLDTNGSQVSGCIVADTTANGTSVWTSDSTVCRPAVQHQLELGYYDNIPQ